MEGHCSASDRGEEQAGGEGPSDEPVLARTELPHELSRDLDRLAPLDLARLWGRRSAEGFAAVQADSCLDALATVADELEAEPPRRILLAGAGTSGRLAVVLVARHRDALAARGIGLEAWLAGGSRGLVEAVEGAEDDVPTALAELAARLDPGDLYVGISSGLSAPCVAAGLAAAEACGARMVLCSAVPADEARATSLPGLPGGFRALVARLLAAGALRLVQPDTGPELLTGSTRLEAGTASFVVLDALLASLGEGVPGAAAGTPSVAGPMTASPRDLIRAAVDERAGECAALCEQFVTSLAEWIEVAGDCLRDGGRVVWLGQGPTGLAGVLDAAECGPTFGAAPDQIAAWVDGGWAAFGLERPEGLRELSLTGFAEGAARGLGPRDLAFLLGGLSCELPCRMIKLPARSFVAAKTLCNAISTGAFVRAGKVWGNRMVDLALSNAKLLDRAQRILAELSGKPMDQCWRSLVAAIWDEDVPARELLRLPAEAQLRQVRLRASRSGLVPLALLHIEGRSLAEARKALARQPVLRALL